jgi:hypothetical protein
MPRWEEIREVTSAGKPAANEPFAAFAQRREIAITRLGAYTRVVLTKRVEATAG